ncbi:MAG: penicillin-binding protein 2 [Bacteroidales bacterium]
MNEFASRKRHLIGFLLIASFVLLGRLFYIQIVDSYYKRIAEKNGMRYEVLYPARGLIYDRNGTLLVGNQTVYDIEIVPREVQNFDTLTLAKVLGQTPTQIALTIATLKAKAKKNAAFQPVLFRRQVSVEAFALLQEKWFKFPGFYVHPRSIRQYSRKLAGNLIGYIAEADTSDIAKDNFYIQGSYIGKIGIEKAYESILRGKRGVSIYMRDVHNRVREPFANGSLDTIAIAGNNLVCTIDVELQEYGEKLMQNKLGSIVAIEPSTGEILAMISAPNFDPETFIDVRRAGERNALSIDPHKPLFNRAVMAQYPPGSIFKTVNALVALQEGVITPYTMNSCNRGYYAGNQRVGCHGHFSPVNLMQSLQVSCNSYYCHIFRNIIDKPGLGSPQAGFEMWRKHVESFGIGTKLESDIPNELRGLLPTHTIYDNMHGRNRWKSLSVISLAIGQGELGVTPLHMANLAAIIANRGFYYPPHVIKSIQGETVSNHFTTPRFTSIASSHFEPVIEGMSLAVNGGPGRTAGSAYIPHIEVCGKTGTAQNPHGADHSVFICFAPRHNPKIAVAVYVENSGFGATWAAPTASLIVEKYLKRNISRSWVEERVVNANLLPHNNVVKK